jgi:hypothetical protein
LPCESPRPGKVVQTPAVWRAFAVNAAGSGGPAGFFPGNSVDVGTRDADIGQFAVGQVAEFAKTSVIASPVSVDFHKGKQYGCLLGASMRKLPHPSHAGDVRI